MAPASLLLLYAAMALAYQRAVPLFEAPDEPSHMQYVAFLAREHRLPRYGPVPDVPGEGWQPPLYYLLSAPVFHWVAGHDPELFDELDRVNRQIYTHRPPSTDTDARIRILRRPNGSALFWSSPGLASLRNLRWASLGFGLLAVLFTYRAIRRAFGDRHLAVLGAGVLAATPQFLFTSAYVNNDTIAAALGAATFWLVAAGIRDAEGVRRRHYVLFSLLAALALVTKNSVLPGLAVAAATLVVADARRPSQRARDAVLAGLVALVPIAPYVAWNLTERGDPLGMGAFWSSVTHMNTPARYGGVLPYLAGTYGPRTFESYWGCMGWMNVQAPIGIYLIYLLLSAAGIVGFVLSGRRRRKARDRGDSLLRRYLVSAILAVMAAHLWLNLSSVQPQGRHLFAAAPQISCLLAIGFTRLWRPLPRPGPGTKGTLALAALLALTAYYLLAVIAPAYA